MVFKLKPGLLNYLSNSLYTSEIRLMCFQKKMILRNAFGGKNAKIQAIFVDGSGNVIMG